MLAIILAVLGGWFTASNSGKRNLEGDVIAMITMRGVIGADARLTCLTLLTYLMTPIQNSVLKALIIEMNSPGGSLFHPALFYDAYCAKSRLIQKIPVLSVVVGGYWPLFRWVIIIASAAK